MGFMDLARERYSVLYYDKREIEEEKLEKILQAGLLAPTACNLQPQRIRVIRNAEDQEKIRQVTGSSLWFDTALLVCYDRQACWTRPCDGKPSGETDAAIVTTHMMLEATELGLGSIYVMSWDPEKMRRAFDLADALEPVALLILGYRAPEDKPRPTHFASRRLEEILL